MPDRRPNRLPLLVAGGLGLALAAATPTARAADPPPRAPASPVAPDRPPSGAAFLERAWPGHPEWLAMLADIVVVGDRLGGADGWFRKGVAQSRFGWDATRREFDRDGDGAVTPAEFAGRPADFARLDRDRDGALGAPDFDFSPPPPIPGMGLFARADRDGNGKITRDEFDLVFRALDDGGLGFLSRGDVQRLFAPPPAAAAGPASAPPGGGGGGGGPSRGTLLKSFLRRELGAFPAGPALDEPAPDFTLPTVDGDEITLSKLVGPKPVVLVFGNFTCGPFRALAGDLEKLHRRYADRATFVMVYVREAHPTDGWRMDGNDRMGVSFPQPRTDAERRSIAQVCNRAMGLGFPMAIDTMDDAVNTRYSGIPSRFYLVDRAGRVAFKSGRGPFGFRPAELEQSLLLLLRHDDREPTASRPGP